MPSLATVPAGASSMRATLALEGAAVEVSEAEQHRQQADADDRQRHPEGRTGAGHVGVTRGDQADHEAKREEDQHAHRRRGREHGGRLAVAAAREVPLAELWDLLRNLLGHRYIAPEPD